MVTEVTAGIKISVITRFQELYSNANNFQFFFAYQICIENQNDFVVQLLKRHWFINDSSGEFREVEGVGVVGQQPIIGPRSSYSYESACNLTTDIGKMRGVYRIKNLAENSEFLVTIPEFQMVAPYRLN